MPLYRSFDQQWITVNGQPFVNNSCINAIPVKPLPPGSSSSSHPQARDHKDTLMKVFPRMESALRTVTKDDCCIDIGCKTILFDV